MSTTDWEPKPGDKAFYLDTQKVTIKADLGDDQFEVRYADKDNFGERAEFTADRRELTERAS